VPAGVPDEAPLLIVKEADCPGPRVTEEAEKDVDHPEGSVEDKLIVFGEHAAESLLVTVTE